MKAKEGRATGRKQSRTQTLDQLGEQRLIAAIRGWLGAANPPSPRGIGDDCAVLPARRRGQRGLITVDPVLAGRHFTTATSPAEVAEKLLRRNLSDIAAMGGVPQQAVIALAAPGDTPVDWLGAFFRALARSARRFGVDVVGGDCAQTDGPLSVWLTLVGAAPRRPLTRQGARRGDLVFVTGSLGGSILGRHLRFPPRLEEGQWLAGRAEVRAAIDLSDGLAKDGPALLPPGTALQLDPRQVPVSPAARRLARRTGRSPLEHACNDGEDYELLFAVAPARVEAFIVAWHRRFATPLACIGKIVTQGAGEPQVSFRPALATPVRLGGYEHFR